MWVNLFDLEPTGNTVGLRAGRMVLLLLVPLIWTLDRALNNAVLCFTTGGRPQSGLQRQ